MRISHCNARPKKVLQDFNPKCTTIRTFKKKGTCIQNFLCPWFGSDGDDPARGRKACMGMDHVRLTDAIMVLYCLIKTRGQL